MSTNNAHHIKLNQVNHLAQTRQLPQALKLVNEITDEYPDFAAAWATKAILMFQSHDKSGAAIAIKTAKDLAPGDFKFAFQEIMMYDSLNRPDLVLPLAQKLSAVPLSDNLINERLARILEINEDFDGALRLYKYLSTSQPNHSPWLLKQASTLQSIGEIKQAEKLCDQVLEKEPNNPDGHFFRSHLKKQTIENNHIDSLRKISQNSQASVVDKAKLYYALAKELEDINEFSDSFEARKTGADLFRHSFQYNVQSDVDFMRQVQIEYDAEFVKQKSTTNLTDRPIFIVGLPRSGTTLLDRIITSHTDVKAAGELKQFNRCMLQELQQLRTDPTISRPEMVTASREIDFNRLGQSYIQTSAGLTGNSIRFTDKFPQNSYYVGMILKALPNAKIIIMQRQPVAVCYSVYKQLFNNDSYPFSYDLKEMAAYYNQHNALLSHWQKVGGDAVKTVYYEDLVNDLENQAKAIMRFLDLTWQPACLDFHKNSQPTATASASQVRQKLYTGSIELWRQYEQQLQPLIDNLEISIKPLKK